MKGRELFLAIIAVCLSSCSHSPQANGSSAAQPSGLGSQFDEDLARHDVIIIGEVHGTSEAPQAIADLSAALGNRTLFALELKPESAQIACPPKDALSTWPRSWKRHVADGRSSEAMLAALCRIRGNTVKAGNDLLLIDTRGAGKRTFYADAAKVISEKLASGRFDKAIVLTGNFHSRRADDKLSGHLLRRGHSALTATISGPKGTAWTCRYSGEKRSCGKAEMTLNFCKGPIDKIAGWTAQVPEKFGWDRCLTLPSITASPPADKSPIKGV